MKPRKGDRMAKFLPAQILNQKSLDLVNSSVSVLSDVNTNTFTLAWEAERTGEAACRGRIGIPQTEPIIGHSMASERSRR
ncbi:hypothetical protein EVAR_40333_1 [Eumeta japonica]|uniref:Uncharacterized protein n=1 Tax=Eumeta variegata TaxID=151549 RepID=A0A4C1YDA9_EUMVA|nr:hypothetical protein EVAR_40333_1 [Eumeta japonica]